MHLKPYLFTRQSKSITHINLLYDFYKRSWVDAFKELDVDSKKITNDFFRFDIKLGFFNDLEPVAFHAYQFFNLELKSDREHPYFNQFNFSLADELLKRGYKKIATLEYMVVSEKYRRMNGNDLGVVLSGFSTQFLSRQKVDVSLTIARNNRSVNKMCELFGGQLLFKELPLNNTVVDVFVFEPHEVKRHPDPQIQDQVDNLAQLAEKPDLNILKVA